VSRGGSPSKDALLQRISLLKVNSACVYFSFVVVVAAARGISLLHPSPERYKAKEGGKEGEKGVGWLSLVDGGWLEWKMDSDRIYSYRVEQ
jgi:hypothetical protein